MHDKVHPTTPASTFYVGAVVLRNDRLLLVRQSVGHPLEGQWTIPWGRVEQGESPAVAAVRETWEEGGVRAEVDGLLGVQELPPPQQGGIALVYLCRHIDGVPRPQDRETDSAGYYSQVDVEAFQEPIELWTRWLIRRVFEGDFTVTYAKADNPLQARGGFL